MGRFLSEDPAGLAANLNLYLFALNNPVGQRDPFGLDAWGLDDIDWLQLGTDFFSKMGSGITWGITDWIQDCMGPGGVVNRDSPVYFVGEFIGEKINDRLTGGMGRFGKMADLTRARNRLADTAEDAAGGLCFAAGTPIATPSGEKPIEAIRPGELVLTRDQQSRQNCHARVVATFRRTAEELLQLETDDERVLRVTPEHPFYVEGRGFVAARRLARSDLLADAGGRPVRVRAVTRLKGPVVVYNFEVARTHSYFAYGLWVHNTCPGQIVIGHYPDYVNKAEELGARYFNIPMEHGIK
jgi:hypothetical protein